MGGGGAVENIQIYTTSLFWKCFSSNMQTPVNKINYMVITERNNKELSTQR